MARRRSRAAWGAALGLLLLCALAAGAYAQDDEDEYDTPAAKPALAAGGDAAPVEKSGGGASKAAAGGDDEDAEIAPPTAAKKAAGGGEAGGKPPAENKPAAKPKEDDEEGGEKPAAAEGKAAAKAEGDGGSGDGAPSARRAGPRAEPKKVKVVEIAPEAEVENDDDIDSEGECADFLPASSCSDVEAGAGKLAECISQLLAAAEASDGGEDTAPVPDKCEAEVYNFYIRRSKNINSNVPLAKACKVDAEKNCNNTWFFGHSEGRVIACLKEIKAKVSPKCKEQLFKLQQASARDFRADPAMREYCAADAEKLCAGVKEGGGRKQACLRDNHLKVSWECAEQLFKQELEADDDIRLSVRLYQRCLADKKRFCADVDPGHAEAKDCLIDHRNDEGFSAACRDELDGMIERRVRDFRLDSRLRRYCQDDIVALCGMLDSLGGDETDINICLQDYVTEIRNDQCKALVKQYQVLAAQDIRFDVPLADACFEDRTKLCANVPPGSARVIRCLQSQRDALSPTCRATLFDEEVRFSENIDFQWPMKRACTKEIQAYCAKVPHGNARVIRCLQENKGKKDFGRSCLKEVLQYEQRASSDYRLNHRLRVTCKADIEALCKDVCRKDGDQVCGGTVLRCLTEKQDDIKSEACKKEVFYFERMEVEDFNNDVILAAACRGDVEQFCKDVKPGNNGGVHACLRSHRGELSDACRREELILETTESERIELRPNLLRSCASERGLFCKDVKPGNARVFRCLADNLADPDFGPVCRGEVISKLQRRQANWKLDPPLRRACRNDVAQMCKTEDDQGSELGVVYKCLVRSYDDLDPGCKKELGRALHMAFFIWIPGGILTSSCDVDIAEACLKERPNMLHEPGAVGACLTDVVERLGSSEAAAAAGKAPAGDTPPALSEQCRMFADVANPPNMKRVFEESLSVALLESQISSIESKTGATLVKRDARGHTAGVTLTGWSALLGIAALVVMLAASARYAWRSYAGVTDPSTVVLKSRQQHKYARVETAGS